MRKLSEIKGEESADVLSDILVPIAELVKDPDVLAAFEKQTVKDGEDARSVAIDKLSQMLPVLLKTHRKEFITILSVIDGKTREEYVSDMTLASLTKDVLSILNDDTFRDFLS